MKAREIGSKANEIRDKADAFYMVTNQVKKQKATESVNSRQ